MTIHAERKLRVVVADGPEQVWDLIAEYQDSGRQFFWRVERIAREFNVCVRTIQNWFEQLELAGRIQRFTRGFHRSSHYKVVRQMHPISASNAPHSAAGPYYTTNLESNLTNQQRVGTDSAPQATAEPQKPPPATVESPPAKSEIADRLRENGVFDWQVWKLATKHSLQKARDLFGYIDARKHSIDDLGAYTAELFRHPERFVPSKEERRREALRVENFYRQTQIFEANSTSEHPIWNSAVLAKFPTFEAWHVAGFPSITYELLGLPNDDA